MTSPPKRTARLADNPEYEEHDYELVQAASKAEEDDSASSDSERDVAGPTLDERAFEDQKASKLQLAAAKDLARSKPAQDDEPQTNDEQQTGERRMLLSLPKSVDDGL
jgi:hypothetical protein